MGLMEFGKIPEEDGTPGVDNPDDDFTDTEEIDNLKDDIEKLTARLELLENEFYELREEVKSE